MAGSFSKASRCFGVGGLPFEFFPVAEFLSDEIAFYIGEAENILFESYLFEIEVFLWKLTVPMSLRFSSMMDNL